MKVWRIENEYGKGPFCGDTWSSGVDGTLPPPRHDPGFPKDYIINERRDIFGAHTGSKLAMWIANPALLIEDGYKVVLYDVPAKKVVKGTYQAVFKAKHARKLGEVCPKKFFNKFEERSLKELESLEVE